MVLLADANFACYELWAIAAATGADLLWRAGAQLGLPAGEGLADGTYLSRLKAPRHLRRQGAEDITVRGIEYHIQDELDRKSKRLNSTHPVKSDSVFCL